MPITGPHWSLITTYKLTDDDANKFRFMEAFLTYYAKSWGIENFIILVGVVPGADFDKISKRVGDLGAELDIGTQTIRYETERTTHTSVWSNRKKQLFSKVDKHFLKPHITKILNIDCDEFIKVEQGVDLNQVSSLHCHLVDYTPNIKFDISSDMRWCVHPFFYRARWKNLDNSFINHGTCKKYYFDRSRMLEPWIHGGRLIGDVCKKMDQIIDPEERREYLKNTSTCYHLAVLDERFYLKSKGIEFVESQTAPTNEANSDELRDIFKLYYLETKYQVYVDNFLKQYWSKNNG